MPINGCSARFTRGLTGHMDTERPAIDPILSPRQMCDEAGISMPTWKRYYRHKLPIIRLSPQRIGCRRSEWRAVLEASMERGHAA